MTGVPASPSGSRPSDRAADGVSPVPASIPNAGFTSGPWHVGVRSTTGEQYGVHAQFLAKHIGIVSGQANARLIAAAPELYDALRTARNQVIAFGLGPAISVQAAEAAVQHIDAALAKARGQ